MNFYNSVITPPRESCLRKFIRHSNDKKEIKIFLIYEFILCDSMYNKFSA